MEYFIIKNNEKVGPLDEDRVRAGVATGEFTALMLAWKPGLSEWKPLSELISFSKPDPSVKQEAGVIFGKVSDTILSVTGGDKVEGLDGKEFFSNVLKRRTEDDIEALFITGTKTTTPPLSEVDTKWPKPWLFFQALVVSLVVFMAFAFGLIAFNNRNFFPGLIMTGAFAIPFSILIFFLEMNVVRNVSFYQVLKLLIVGGIGSLVLAIIFFSVFRFASIIGASAAGCIEEPAKLLVVAFLMGHSKKYNWILNGMLFGAAVGTGFAAFETAGYAFKAGLDIIYYGGNAAQMNQAAIHSIIFRGLVSPGMHVAWSALTCAALWKVKGDGTFMIEILKDKRFLKVFIPVVVMHTLWNAPIDFFSPIIGGYIKMAVLTTIAWIMIMSFIQTGLKQIRTAQKAASGNVPDPSSLESAVAVAS